MSRRARCAMIVLDASATVEWLFGHLRGRASRSEFIRVTKNETLHAPHLLGLEFTQVLRRLVLEGMPAASC